MTDHEKNIRVLKGYLTHVVAFLLIVPMVGLLVWSAFDKNVAVPTLLLSLGSGAVGYYLSHINGKK